MKLSELYEIFVHHPIVTTDSRNCPIGSIFFALKGEHFDGNKYAKHALNAGCAYAVIDNPEYKEDDRFILTEDVLQTLQQLALRHRKTLGTPIIGITGTNGKTTTKELIAAVLSKKYNILYTEGNFNNELGVPLTLLRLNYEHEMAVIEMGASHPGDIKSLVEMVHPNYGIITNVGEAHLEGFGSFENIVKTKGELFDYIRKNKGTVFIHNENEHLKKIAQGIEQITYGSSESNFTSGHVVECNPFLTFNWKQQGKIHEVKTQLVGSYNIDNVLAAVAIGRYFKIPAERISRAIAAYEPTNNRSQFKSTDKNQLIIDAYNANPTSMRIAIENFSNMESENKMVILGDMRELGIESEKFHQEIVDLLKQKGIHDAILCGEMFAKTDSEFKCFENTDLLKEYLISNPIKNKQILIKGSHGLHLESLPDLL